MTDVLYFLKYRLTKKLLLLISAVTVIEIGTTTILAKPSTSKITIFGTWFVTFALNVNIMLGMLSRDDSYGYAVIAEIATVGIGGHGELTN